MGWFEALTLWEDLGDDIWRLIEKEPHSRNVLRILELLICIGNLRCLLSFEYHAKNKKPQASVKKYVPVVIIDLMLHT